MVNLAYSYCIVASMSRVRFSIKKQLCLSKETNCRERLAWVGTISLRADKDRKC